MFLVKIVQGSAVSLALLAMGQVWAAGLAEDNNEDTTASTYSWPSPSVLNKDPLYDPYAVDLQKRIKRAWFPPKGLEDKRVKVVFELNKDGRMTNLRILISSGLQLVDEAARQAVKNAAPFRPLPDGAPNKVSVEFTFDFKAFDGGGKAVFRH